jgi:hypothetical protein
MSGETVHRSSRLHPLGLDSSGFEGFGRVLARRGLRTIAADLPGFGRTPAPDLPLRPDVLAQPVIELARSRAHRSSSGSRSVVASRWKPRSPRPTRSVR